ncbi:hypothetical protein IJD34_01250 [bacterium]|nr:hypothetical protein [bacterium]
MPLVINANMKLFADRMNISSSRMINDYGLSTVDEIIEAEAEKGNEAAVHYARRYYSNPERLIKVFELADIGNKFKIINKMNDRERALLLPKLSQQDLVMGLHFFTQEKLLAMLMYVDIYELVNVVKEAFPLEAIVMMFTEDELSEFFLKKELERHDVMEQLRMLPPDVMQKFIEGVTGMPSNETSQEDLFRQIDSLTDEQYRKFMSAIDPEVQRQLTFQVTEYNPEYLTLFENESYVRMLSTKMKPDMIKPMIMLNQETLIKMMLELPDSLMSIVTSQIDERKLAIFLQDGHMDLIEDAWMI